MCGRLLPTSLRFWFCTHFIEISGRVRFIEIRFPQGHTACHIAALSSNLTSRSSAFFLGEGQEVVSGLMVNNHLSLLPLKNFEVEADDLVTISELGRGAYGVVEKVRHAQSGTIMAVKVSRASPTWSSTRGGIGRTSQTSPGHGLLRVPSPHGLGRDKQLRRDPDMWLSYSASGPP